MTTPRDPAVSGAFVGVIPSAGASLRMGRPKGLMDIEGETFLRRTVAALSGGGCEPVFVVVPTGDVELAAEAAASGAAVLENPEPGDGPITSLRLVLDHLDETVAGVAYLPVDHPMVLPETVAFLLREARSTGAALTLPMRGAKRGHPALFGAALFDELTDPGLEGGARTVVHRHLGDALKLQVDDPGVLTDIDTPEAYEALISAQTRVGGARP